MEVRSVAEVCESALKEIMKAFVKNNHYTLEIEDISSQSQIDYSSDQLQQT
jgi:hypothetical protein